MKNFFNIHITKKITINIWVLPVFFCSLIGGYFNMFLCAYLIAFLHEMAHVLCANKLNVSISEIKIYPFGITARLSSEYINSSEKEFIIAFAGPLLNIILFWICISVNKFLRIESLNYCTELNLVMCTFNLIPSLPLDGGRMLKSILTSKYGIIRSYNIMIKISKIIISLLIVLSVAVFLLTDFNFSLILISAFLLQNLCAEQQNVSIITLREILNNSSKLSANKEYISKSICVCENVPARTLLKYLSYDCYFIIHITDSSSNIIKTVTETQVLKALTSKGLRIQYKDIKTSD